MLVTTHNSELVRKLVALANGDIDLVQRAVRASSKDGQAADLEAVVNFIVQEQKTRARAVA